MHLTFPDATIDWATKKLMPLFRLRGAPTAASDQGRYAASILRIAHPRIVELRYRDPHAAIPEGVAEALEFTAKQLDAVRIEHPTMGPVNPFAWLIDVTMDDCRFFPEPMEMRLIFIERFPCADGRRHAAARGGTERKK